MPSRKETPPELDLYAAIAFRHSTRAYDGRPLLENHIKAISRACAASGDADHTGDTGERGAERIAVPEPGFAKSARVVLVTGPADSVFTGLAIKNVPAYLAMIGDTAALHVEEAVGYLGEYVVLAATSAGVATCWVSASFRPDEVAKEVSLGPTERVFAVSPLGYEGRPGVVETFYNKLISKSRTRKPLEELLAPESMPLSARPAWVKTALEAARLAPSAYNRQPWRFTIGQERIKVSVDPTSREVPSAPRRMDCGMAMIHLELGALAAGVRGAWKPLEGSDVAVYTLE